MYTCGHSVIYTCVIAYFHSMPEQHLPFSGFHLGATNEPEKIRTNSLAAYRIHEKDPVLFADSLQFYWVASSDNARKEDGWCNYAWPSSSVPAHAPTPEPAKGHVSVDALAWVYVW